MVIRAQLVSWVFVYAMLAGFPGAWGQDAARPGYIGAFPVESPLSIASDGVSRLFIASMGGRITTTDLEGKELYSFGGPGSPLNKVLLEPSGLLYYNGKLYVVDSWHSHVVVLAPEGELLDVYGRSGKGPKEFNEPRGIYVSGGLIYVSDTGNSRIQVLGPNGVYLMEFGNTGKMPEKLWAPSSVAVGGNGVAYVIDSSDGWLKLYDMRGTYLKKVSRLRRPVKVALAGSGLVVADSHEGTLGFFSMDGEHLGVLGPWGRNATPFEEISGVVAVGDMVYASDSAGNEVKMFRVPGEGLTSEKEAPSGLPFAEYGGEISIADIVPGKLVRASDGRLYVLDRSSGTIIKLGKGAGATAVGPKNCSATSFDVGAGGDIYCLDASKGRVLVSSKEGAIRGGFDLFKGRAKRAARPVDIGASSSGSVYIADRGLGEVQVYGPKGSYRGALGIGGTNFYIQDPVALRVEGGDMLYIADAANRTVYIYSPEGRLIREVWDVGTLSTLGSLAVYGGFIYVLDRELPDIKVFNKTGMLIMSFGSRGGGKGEFSTPASIEVDSEGYLVASDTGNKRLQRLSVHISPEFVRMMRMSKSTREKGKGF